MRSFQFIWNCKQQSSNWFVEFGADQIPNSIGHKWNKIAKLAHEKVNIRAVDWSQIVYSRWFTQGLAIICKRLKIDQGAVIQQWEKVQSFELMACSHTNDHSEGS